MKITARFRHVLAIIAITLCQSRLTFGSQNALDSEGLPSAGPSALRRSPKKLKIIITPQRQGPAGQAAGRRSLRISAPTPTRDAEQKVIASPSPQPWAYCVTKTEQLFFNGSMQRVHNNLQTWALSNLACSADAIGILQGHDDLLKQHDAFLAHLPLEHETELSDGRLKKLAQKTASITRLIGKQVGLFAQLHATSPRSMQVQEACSEIAAKAPALQREWGALTSDIGQELAVRQAYRQAQEL